MKIGKLKFVFAFILGITISMSAQQVAMAYQVNGAWANSTKSYYYASSVPTSFRTYINKGANAWTNVTPSPWTWSLTSSSGMKVSYVYIDGPVGALGQTAVTYFGSIIISATMKYDNSENWYAGTGVPGTIQFDLWSVGTHEMGHGLGLAETSGIYCPGNTYDATMCPSLVSGTYYLRTLEGDDRNGVNYLYP